MLDDNIYHLYADSGKESISVADQDLAGCDISCVVVWFGMSEVVVGR